MSASAKTEQPTEKKKRDAGKKGQIWRSQDLITLVMLFGGVCLLRYGFSLADIIVHLLRTAEAGFQMPRTDYVEQSLAVFLRASAVVTGVAMVLSVLPNLLMSRFRLASQAVRFDFAALNPVAGFKKIFNLRTIKDSVKACLYLGVFIFVAKVFWHTHRIQILGLYRLGPQANAHALRDLAFELSAALLGAALIVALLDLALEYLLYIRDLKMTRSEVRREYKDQFGTPEIKQERRRLGHELLSGEVLANVEQSNIVLANPTHIAIGIYINPAISPLPFISVMEMDEHALAVIAHARERGIPVIRDVPLARRIFAKNRRYSFVSEDCLEEIGRVLLWLVDVEKSRQAQFEATQKMESAGGPTTVQSGGNAGAQATMPSGGEAGAQATVPSNGQADAQATMPSSEDARSPTNPATTCGRDCGGASE